MKKQVILKSINLIDFKGQTSSFTFGDTTNKITGKNRAGKSTIMKAWNWLLTSFTDADSKMNSDLFDNRLELSPDTPMAIVEALVSIDGNEFKIKRTAKCKFTKKRGTTEYVKSPSDEYKFYIDDVEYAASDFNKWLDVNICDNNKLKLAINGQFFLRETIEKKDKARESISEIIGEVSDDEIEGDFENVRKELESGLDIDLIASKASASATNIKQRIVEIQASVDIKKKEIDELRLTDYASIERQVNEKEKAIEDIDNTILGLSETTKPIMDEIRSKEGEKRAIEATIEQSKKTYESQFESDLDALNRKKENAVRRNGDIERNNKNRESQIQFNKQQIENYKSQVSTLEKDRENLLSQRKQIIERKFDGEYCSLCGQRLPDDMIEKALDEFNKRKEQDLNNIVSRGKSVRANIDNYTNQIEKLNDDISKVSFDKIEDLSGIDKEIDDLKNNHIYFESTEQYKELKNKLDSIVVPEIPTTDTTDLKIQKSALQKELGDLNKKLGLKDRIDVLQKDIDDLAKENREKANLQAFQERLMQEVTDYKQARMAILTKRVNDQLNHSRIEIFSTQKNGTIIPDLVIKDEMGVNYATTNGASRLTIAADLQHLFSESLDVSLPYFIDESSIMNDENLPRFEDSQMFYLYCTNDESVKVEGY